MSNPTDAQYNPPIPEPTNGPVDELLGLPVTGEELVILLVVGLALIVTAIILKRAFDV